MDENSTILIVDDNEMNIKVATLALNSPGYTILVAESGKQALEMLEENAVDCILLDIMMPDMDGFTVCRSIKKRPELENVPIIFLTARTDLESIRRAFECGGNDFISKPFQKTELKVRVETQLHLKKHVEQIEAISNERNQLLHILSHDLANPIGAALAVVSMMEEDPEYFEEGLSILKNSLKNGSEIIHFIRTIRQLERSDISLRLKNENLRRMVDESVIMLSHLWKPKKQQIVVNIDPSLQVNVERNSFITSVVNNLLSNAIKFSYPETEIDISGERAGEGDVNLLIRDNGIGIPEELLGDLFSLLNPSSRPGTEGEFGTGYGMPLVKRFVEAYGGTIDIESDDNGTLVTCRLKAP